MKPKLLPALDAAFAGIIAIYVVDLPHANGQQPQEFEVASIKPTRNVSDGVTSNLLPGGRFQARNITLKALIQSAFGVKDFQVEGGPRWLDSTRYDVSAITNTNREISEEELRPLLQTLLADRFKLKLHREMKDVPVYSLTVAKGGSKLVEHTGTDGPSGGMLSSSGKAIITARKATTARLADGLARALGRNVVDNTRLTGFYDFKLEWALDQTADATGPSIFTALQEQLGLKLESTKAPGEVLVIDIAEKASED